MARHTAELYSTPDAAWINLTNLISRLEENLLSCRTYHQTLLSSEYHRARVSANVEHARTLLLQLERTLPTLKNPSRKQTLQADLTQKREQIKALKQCLDDIAVRAQVEDTDDVSSENEEDILMHTPQASTSGNPSPRSSSMGEKPSIREGERDIRHRRPDTEEEVPAPLESTASSTLPPTLSTSDAAPPGTSALRQRHATTASTSTPTATTTGASTSLPQPTTSNNTASDKTLSTESALDTSRAEQEALTASLLSLASDLKASSHTFHSSLESEKSVLARAVEGLDRNITGMEAAGRRMGMLRKMTEGRGWWGRMIMYLWIFGLWLLAVLIVFVGPKLRF